MNDTFANEPRLREIDASEADVAALVREEEARLAALTAALAEAPSAPGAQRPDAAAPYAARLRLAVDGGGVHDLLLGEASFAAPARGVRVVDWRASPFGALFFRCAEGEAFSIDVQGRPVRGRVLLRRLVEIRGGSIVAVEGGPGRVARRPDGRWARVGPPWPRLGAAVRVGRDVEAPAGRLPAAIVAGLFDDAQAAALAHDGARPLLVTGGAGTGKTTVALHRLARLHRADPARFPERALLVVVPEPALAARAQALLAELHLHAVRCTTFDAWAARLSRRLLPLPERDSEARGAAVIAFKRHPALREVLGLYVAQLGAALAAWLDRRLAARGAVEAAWPTTSGASLRARLDALAAHVLRDTPASLAAETRAAFAEAQRRLFAARPDLLELFGDRALLDEVVARAGGELLPGAAAEVLAHTKLQFSATADEEFAHVDAESRKAVDGRGLDEGTPQEDAATVDPEDHAVALELLARKTGGLETPRGSPGALAAIVIDEAQDLAPIELAALGRALRPGGCLTVCGDPMQQIDPALRFRTWEETMEAIGLGAFDRVELPTSHRCPAPIVRFARGVLGPLAAVAATRGAGARAGEGGALLVSRYDGELQAAAAVGAALLDLVARAPAARVAVIARAPAQARALHARLPPALGARLALGDALSRAPGVDVTTVAQVKGLEFDVVVVPDATAATYPDDAPARRTLYVACTRARGQLWLVSPGSPSPILPREPPARGRGRLALPPGADRGIFGAARAAAPPPRASPETKPP